jgi:hypothetical protein
MVLSLSIDTIDYFWKNVRASFRGAMPKLGVNLQTEMP